MDDGFLPVACSSGNFGKALNNLHPAITFTVESSEYITSNRQQLNFLDINVLLTDNVYTETDIYYKVSNSHDYLNYHSYHPRSTIKNIPFNLSKRIIVFVSNSQNVEYRLNELRQWLKDCNFPHSAIQQGIHNAFLQGPAPNPENKKFNIPLATTYYPQLQLNSAQKCINNMLLNIKDKKLKEKLQTSQVILARKQPKSLLRILSKAAFTSSGVTGCKRTNCKQCKMYLVIPGTQFTTANN